VILVVLALLGTVLASHHGYAHAHAGKREKGGYRLMFEKFLDRFGKRGAYNSEEEMEMRYKIFKGNMRYIEQFNAEEHSYTLGVNQFGDLTNEEFRLRHATRVEPVPATGVHRARGNDLPASIEWRDKNAVTKVKDQGSCGSCWAFSATGSMEGSWAIKMGNLVPLSEQQLVDCDKLDSGCNGGMMHTAFEYVIKNGGIDRADCYPYLGYDAKCKFDAKCIGAKFTSYTNVTENDDNSMMSAVAQQPISIAICASTMSFQFYSKGVFDDSRCPKDWDHLDHGVLIVGYGTDSGSGKKFYIVKNSWGGSWGEKGYIRMAHGDGRNMCGLLDYGVYPNV